MELRDYKGGYVIIQEEQGDARVVDKEDLEELIEEGKITSDTPVYVAQRVTTSFNANNFMDEVAEQEGIDYEFCSLNEKDELELQKLLNQVAKVVNRNINWYNSGEELDISELFGKESR